jgi:hypothetical protein
MPKPNDELLERVLEDQSPTLTPQQRFREETARWFKDRKNVYAGFGIMIGLMSLAMLYRGGMYLYVGLQANRTDLVANGSLMLMVGLAVPIFCILWSRIDRANDITLEQLLLLRSELSRLQSGESGDTPKADARMELGALLPDSLREQLTSRWHSRIVVQVTGIAALITSVAVVLTLTLSPFPPNRPPVITQADQWRIAPGDRVVVRSRIRFERSPADSHFVTLAMPYSAAEITSITADDRPLQFSKLDWRRYEVERPIGSFAAGPPEILVVWEFPIERLAPVDDGYWTSVAALLSVTSYRLELVVDEGSGYEIVGHPKNEPFVPFLVERRRPEKTFFGWCRLPVRKKIEQ